MDYEESVEWLSGLARYGIKLGLDRFEELLKRAGSPQTSLRAVHVAGTNGKGSTTTMTARGLQAAGFKTGLYLSPYVFDMRERIQINGEMIPRRRFADLASEARKLVEELEPTGHGQATEFEVKTLIGFLHFAREKVDYACVEVGLGGRLDATNVLTPLVSVITNVFMDHMDRLGDTLALIAGEKAGIIKEGVPLVSGAREPEAVEVILRVAREHRAPILSAHEFQSAPTDAEIVWRRGGSADEFDLSSGGWNLKGLHPRLRGEFQASNAACAAGVLLCLRAQGVDVPDRAIRSGIEEAWLPGRLQVMREHPMLVADGAHNPAAAAVVARFLREQLRGRPLVLVIGMMESHEPGEVLRALAPLADYIVATEPPAPGRRSAGEMARAVAAFGSVVREEASVESAIEIAVGLAGSDGVVCVTGSFYLVGGIPERMRGRW